MLMVLAVKSFKHISFSPAASLEKYEEVDEGEQKTSSSLSFHFHINILILPLNNNEEQRFRAEAEEHERCVNKFSVESKYFFFGNKR